VVAIRAAVETPLVDCPDEAVLEEARSAGDDVLEALRGTKAGATRSTAAPSKRATIRLGVRSAISPQKMKK